MLLRIFSNIKPIINKQTQYKTLILSNQKCFVHVKASHIANSIHPIDAIKKAQSESKKKFDESVDIDIVLGIDPRKPGQNIRCQAEMPFGTGKKISVCAFAPEDMKEKIIEAGAKYGDEKVIEEIKKGNIDFTSCLATPNSMKLLKPVARILGPKGLMPNAKSGTLGKDIIELIKKSQHGTVELRVDKTGIIHCSIGKVSFPSDSLVGNFKSVIETLFANKPPTSQKFIISASVCTTQGKSVFINAKYLDPRTKLYMSKLE